MVILNDIKYDCMSFAVFDGTALHGTARHGTARHGIYIR
jgi:hypothetical protein